MGHPPYCQPQPAAQRTGFALLEPELTPHNGRIWLRLRVSDGIGGRQYLVKSIPQFLDAVEQGESVSYGKSLAFVHRWDAFAPDAQQLLRLLRRQVSARQAFEAEGTVRSGWEKGPAGGLPLTGEGLDALVELYAAEGVVGGYTLKEGLPVISLKVERRKGGVQLSCTPALSGVQGLDYAYLLGETTLWRMQREECRRVLPVLETFGGRSLFFTSADAAAFCSYVLPELGNRVNIVDPDRLLLNQIPLEPVVQFYLDADRGLTVTAYPVFLYGEDRVAPGEPVPPDLLRDARTENRAKRLLETYLEPESGKPGHYSISGEEALFRELLPEFRMPPDLLARTEQRSLIFFAPAGAPFALCALLTLISRSTLPGLTVTLLFPTFFFAAGLAGGAMGYRREGVWLREGRLTLRRQRGIYLHSICVFHPDICLTARQSPWAVHADRTNLTVAFPGFVRLTVRSIPWRDAQKCFEFLERSRIS